MQKEGNCQIGEYIHKTIGLDFKFDGSADELIKSLPQYLKLAFDFSLVQIDGQGFVLLIPSTEVDMSAAQIVKFARQIEGQTRRPTLIQFRSLDHIKRRTLIINRVNFAVVDKQIYLPTQRAYLNESGSVHSIAAKEALSPSSQFLLLYHLQVKSLEGVPFKEMADMLGYSAKTISLSVAELQASSICEVGQGLMKNKILRFPLKGRELWDSISPLMTSPIHKVWYIEQGVIPADLLLYSSYDTALAHFTFIASSSLSSFAIYKRIFARHQKSLQPYLHVEEGTVRLEVWKYDPALLADGQFVDKLSLALCYKDAEDERVRSEVAQMIDKIAW